MLLVQCQKQIAKFFDAGAFFGRQFEYASIGIDHANVLKGKLPVEITGFGQIDFAYYNYIGEAKRRWILERLVFAFGHRKNGEAQVFAEVKSSGAD